MGLEDGNAKYPAGTVGTRPSRGRTPESATSLLCEMKIPRREAGLGDVVERHGVVGVDGEHRVGAGLA
jgi:hypothetical protein